MTFPWFQFWFKSDHTKKIGKNLGWLLLDHFFRLGGTFLILIWLARVIGPAQFGIYNYVISYLAIFVPIASLGIDGILIRNLVKNPKLEARLLGSAFLLKLLGGIFAAVLSIGFIFFIRPQDPFTHGLVFILALGFIVQAFDTLDCYFQAQTLSKYTVIARNVAFIFAGSLKLVFIMMGCSLMVIMVVTLFELILAGFFQVVLYRTAWKGSLLSWQIDPKIFGYLLKEGFPLIFSNLFILISIHSDKLLVRELVGETQAGFYFAATWLSYVCYFIPLLIGNSVVPSLIQIRKMSKTHYQAKIQTVYTLLTLLALGISLFTFFFSPWIIQLFYGDSYRQAGPILSIHIWVLVAFFHVSIRNRVWIIEHRQNLITFYAFLTVIISLGMNFLLIPRFGGIGAAYGSVLSWWICAGIFPFLYSKTTLSARMFLNSFLFFVKK